MREWLSSGTIVARYQISSRLSANGLGEVYLAKELSTEREVALKLLPPDLVREDALKKRFMRIYASITRLRHRNICQIFEGGITESGRPFIAMEYIKGQSLDMLGYGHQLNLAEIIEIVIQIAEALQHAHQSGWLHLEVKPSNLILKQGLKVLVLDFGQSLAFPPSISTATSEPFGLTTGNAAYLSPEMVSGDKPDQRADIFSLGVVLYEMLAGHTPFVGQNVDEVLASVALAQPLPLTEFREDLPGELTSIVGRALAKDPGDRYQTMAEMVYDLKGLNAWREGWFGQAETSLGKIAAALGVDHPAGTSVADMRHTGRQRHGKGDGLAPGSFIEDLKKALSSLLASQSKNKSGRAGRMILLTDRSLIQDAKDLLKSWWQRILIISLFVAGLVWAIPLALQLWSDNNEKELIPSGVKSELLTSVGKVTDAAISPDGRTIAYSATDGDNQNLMVRSLDGSGVFRIASAGGPELRGLTFSPDGKSVAFVTGPASEGGELYRVGINGGAVEKLSDDPVIGSPAFSPDNRLYAYIAADRKNSETALVIVEAGGIRRSLTSRKSPSFFYPGGLTWSPDGKNIACVVNDASSGLYLKIITVAVDGTGEKTLNSGRWSEIERIAWMPDGSGMIVSATGPYTRSMQLWRIESKTGQIFRITGDKSDYRGASLSADSRSLISVQHEALSNIWIASGSDVNRARQLTSGIIDGVTGLNWADDDRIVYVSSTGGRETIWITGLSVNEQRPLPVAPEGSAGGEYQPAVSPDGKTLVYVVQRPNGTYLWRSELDRRNLRRLTDESMVFHPVFTLDGRSVIYSVMRGQRRVIAQQYLDGRAPKTLIERPAWRTVLSPDGTKLACNYWDEATGRWGIGIFRSNGGLPISVFNAPGSWYRVIRWLPDSQAVAYPVTIAGITNILVQPLAGGDPVRMTDSHNSRIFDFTWSGSGNYIAYARGWVSSDVVILTNFR